MKRTVSIVMLLAGLYLSLSPKAEAAGLCCQLSSGVQESLSGVAAPGDQEATVQFTYSFTRMDKIKEGSTERSLDSVKATTAYTSLPVSMDMMKYTLTAGYGFSRDLKAFVSIPFIRNTMDMTSRGMMGWMDMTMAPVSGLGDITVMGLYRLRSDREIRPTNAVTLGLGVKTASGSSTERSASGKLVHAHMQPGTGSWDPLISVMYTRMANPFLFQADATYQYTTKNRQAYEFGNSMAINVSGKYAVVKEFNITAGLTYLDVGRASDPDGRYYNPATNSSLMDDPANTGGKSLWFSPGIQLFPVKNGMIDLKYQVPVRETVNGVQLVSSYRYLVGISYNF
ncbi:MAG TPA: transporter [Nitrospirota bacterium]